MTPQTSKTDDGQDELDAALQGILDRFYSDRKNFRLKKYNAYSQAVMEIWSLVDTKYLPKQEVSVAIGEDELLIKDSATGRVADLIENVRRDHRNIMRAHLRSKLSLDTNEERKPHES